MQKTKKNISKIIKNNIYMLGFVKKAAPWFIFITCAVSFTALVDTVSNTWFSKVVFDSMEKRSSFKMLILTIVGLLFFMLVSSIIRTIYYQKCVPKENQKITGYLRAFLFEKTRDLDLMYYENSEFYNKYTRALEEADSRAIAVLSSVSQLSYSIIVLATLFSIIVYLDPILIIFAVAGSLLSAMIAKRLSKLRYKYNYDKTIFDRKMSYVNRVFYEPQYAKEMKIDTLHFYFIDFYKKILKDTIYFIKNRTNKIAWWEFLAGIQNVILQTLMTIFLTWRVYTGVISIGDYAALLNGTFSLIFQLQSFSTLIPMFYEHSLYIENFREIIRKEPNIEKDQGLSIDTDKPIQIEFCNVTFSYPNTNHIVLKDVNLLFSSGDKHAIVGHNGAGKSTIIKLILRLYDVNQGTIFVNGKNIKEYNIFSLRKAMATVFQDFQIYAMPISDYILSHKYNENTEKDIIMEAIESAGLKHKFQDGEISIHSSLTKEFDDNGIILSGGENQKLAIAKAITRNAGMIIMDEASSALDPISEYELNQKMLSIAKGKTIILISHRLSTTKDANIIYYMENGKVMERGSHKELMDLNGKYARMFHVQADSFSV